MDTPTERHLPIQIEFLSQTNRVFPSFYEEAARFEAEGQPTFTIGRSVTHPFAFYIFQDGKFVADVMITPALQYLVNHWDELLPAAGKESADAAPPSE